MSSLRQCILASISLFWLVPAVHSAEPASGQKAEPPKLTANPFSRPKNLASKRAPGPNTAGRTSVGNDRGLRAVLSGGNGGLANIGGALIETGSLFDGYLLMRIERDTAIFMRGGEEIRIEIGEDLPNE